MTTVFRRRLAGALVVVLLATGALAGCSSTPNKSLEKAPSHPLSAAELDRQARTLYLRAHKLMEGADYVSAIKAYDKVIARFPFTPYATQAQLEQIYAQYRDFDQDDATASADRFLREHPRHPHADYVYYLKGLIDQSRDQGLLQYLPISTQGHDPNAKKQAFQDFALLLQRYPHSRYAWDARQRMIRLRNRIADHELVITRFYMRRGAWLAAARRAEGIIEKYPGAPATAQALLDLKRCDSKLGLQDQVKQVDALIAANRDTIKAARHPVVLKASDDDALPPAMPSAHNTVTATSGSQVN